MLQDEENPGDTEEEAMEEEDENDESIHLQLSQSQPQSTTQTRSQRQRKPQSSQKGSDSLSLNVDSVERISRRGTAAAAARQIDSPTAGTSAISGKAASQAVSSKQRY